MWNTGEPYAVVACLRRLPPITAIAVPARTPGSVRDGARLKLQGKSQLALSKKPDYPCFPLKPGACVDAWYVVCSRPQQETRAAIELANQSFEVFLPVLDAKPMFSRYLFVRFDVDQDDWAPVKHTRGCIDLLRNGYTPSPVPDPVIMALKAYRPPEKAVEGQTRFEPGQRVVIENGVLCGLVGLFQADIKSRTACLLEILGKRVEVPRQSIRAA